MQHSNQSDRLYDHVANRVTQMIRRGSLKPGDRIPSIRSMSNQMSVAISTVLHAYQLLEDRGLIEARPQSGYFVRPKHLRHVADAMSPMEPEMLRLPLRASTAKLQEAEPLIVQTVARSNEIRLGVALPAMQYLPTDTLSKHLARAVRYQPEATGQYELTPGLTDLRVRIAQRAMNSGCSFGPDDVLITNGTTEALSLALKAVTKPGDVVAVESPCYFGFLSLIDLLDLKVVEVSTDPRDGISVDHLEKLINHSKVKLKALLLTANVHNPLGSIMPEEKKRRVVELMSKEKIPIIEDDTYGDLAFESPRPRCLMSFDNSGYVMLCSSFSKTIAPGYRVGWIAAGRWHEIVNDLKRTLSLATATPLQMAMASYLETGGFDAHLRRLRKTYREQLRLLSDAVRRYFPDGTRATNPAGGHLLWVELPENVDADALREELTSHNISLLSGSIFSAGNHYRNCVRLNAAIQWSHRVEKAISLIGHIATGILK